MESLVVPDSRAPASPDLTLSSPVVIGLVRWSLDAGGGCLPARPAGSAPDNSPGPLGVIDDGREVVATEAALLRDQHGRR